MNDDKLHIALTDNEVNLVLTGLGELPAKASYNLLGRVLTEFQQEQQRRKQPRVSPPPPEDPTSAGYAADDD